MTRDPVDIAAAQRLRFQVFYQEMGAQPNQAMTALGRDFDTIDEYCDHLLVYDRQRPTADQVVGTYRLLRQAVAERHAGFYSAGEYDVGPVLRRVAAAGGLLELGRSCVHRDYRTNASIQLLWRGIARYVGEHAITHMFGCASFPGTDPSKHALALAYLWHNHLAPPELRARALARRYVAMDTLPRADIALRAAFQALPPLVKAYLRLGAYVGDGAVIDQQFGTTDVFIMLPVERIAAKYFTHFDRAEILPTDL